MADETKKSDDPAVAVAKAASIDLGDPPKGRTCVRCGNAVERVNLPAGPVDSVTANHIVDRCTVCGADQEAV